MYPPIRYGDARINFDLHIGASLYVRSTHSMQKIGRQMVFSFSLKLWMDCGGSFTNSQGPVHGFAELKGTIANFQFNQETQVVLKSEDLYVRDVSIATVIPHSYRTTQKYQLYECTKGTMFWRRRIWCNWVFTQDRDNWVTSGPAAKVVTEAKTRYNDD